MINGKKNRSIIGCYPSICSQCCCLPTEKVFPGVDQSVDKVPKTFNDVDYKTTSAETAVLPLESLWAAGLDNGMGLGQLYKQKKNNHYSITAVDNSNSPSKKNTDLPNSPPPIPAKYISGSKSRSRRADSDPDQDKDPLTRLVRNLRAYYRDLASNNVTNRFLVSCASMLPPGSLCPTYLMPDLNVQFGNSIKSINVSELLAPITFRNNVRQEAPRKILIEGDSGVGKTSTMLKLLHCWATQNDWNGPDITLILFIPLNELHEKSIFQYLTKELFPNISERWTSSAALNDFRNLWGRNFIDLEDKLLFVLDSFDSVSDKQDKCFKDLHDLISGRLFPKCRMVITSRPTNVSATLFVNRKVAILGRQWGQVKKLFNTYFNEDTETTSDLIRIIENSDNYLKQLSQAPLGWFCISLLFKYCNNSLPSNKLELYEKMIQCLISKKMTFDRSNMMKNIDFVMHDFAKYALSTLKKSKCDNVKNIRMNEFGLLNKTFAFGRTQKRTNDIQQYHFIHNSIAEYLAAFYIYTSSKTDLNLKNELLSLPGINECNLSKNTSTLSVLQFLMGLLRSRAYLIFKLLQPNEFHSEFFMNLPKFGGPFEKNILTICQLLDHSKTTYNDTFFPRVNLTSVELEGWSQILVSDFCNLTKFELFYQSENGSNFFLDIFFGALSFNKSVTSIRLCSIFDQDYNENDLKNLVNCIKTILKRPNLKCFELMISCFDEKNFRNFQWLIEEMCLGLEKAKNLQKLVLDMNFSSLQIHHICKTLEKMPNISVLHVPHTCFDIDSGQQFANVINKFFLTELNINGSWFSHDDTPSSSGVSSGSLNSFGKLMKDYATLPTEEYEYQKLLRFNTLPTNQIQIQIEEQISTNTLCPKNLNSTTNLKQVSDSLNHSTVFQNIFNSIQNPLSVLTHLHISKCKLSTNDLNCLSDSISKSTNLKILFMENYSKFSEIAPILQGICKSPESKLVQISFSSTRIVLNDSQFEFLLRTFEKCHHLHCLKLDGWSYQLEDPKVINAVENFLWRTKISDLSVMNNRIQLNCTFEQNKMITTNNLSIKNESIQVIQMQGSHILINDGFEIFGGMIANYLHNFVNLQEVNLDCDKSRNKITDEYTLITCFKTISKLEHLRKLSMENWRICIEHKSKTIKKLKNILKNCNLNCISLRNCSIYNRKHGLEHIFIKLLFANLHRITLINVIQIPFSLIQMKFLVNVFKTHLSVGQTTIFIDNHLINYIVDSMQKSRKVRIACVQGQNHFIKLDKF